MTDKTGGPEPAAANVIQALRDDIEKAKNVCAGCNAFRDRHLTRERFWRKCGQCPMDALCGSIEALQKMDTEGLK